MLEKYTNRLGADIIGRRLELQGSKNTRPHELLKDTSVAPLEEGESEIPLLCPLLDRRVKVCLLTYTPDMV